MAQYKAGNAMDNYKIVFELIIKIHILCDLLDRKNQKEEWNNKR